MGTGHHHRPKTLLAGVNTAFAELIALMPAVLAQKERLFQTPFLIQAITHPASVASSAVRASLGLSAPRTPVSRPPATPGWRAFLRGGMFRGVPAADGNGPVAVGHNEIFPIFQGVALKVTKLQGVSFETAILSSIHAGWQHPLYSDPKPPTEAKGKSLLFAYHI